MNFKPMLAAKANPDKLRFPLIVQPKLDGIRASVVNGKLVSRTLKPIPNQEIAGALGKPEFEGLDGELIVGEPTAEDVYRRTASFVMARDKTGEPWTYYVFDKWNHPRGFQERYYTLLESGAMWGTPNICLVGIDRAYNQDELATIEATMIAAGHEGAILRDPSGLYKFGRASATKGELLKLKRFEDSEAIIIGVEEEMHNGNAAQRNALGRTERSTAKAGLTGKGTLGKLLVRDVDSGVEFKVGTGFSAADRAELWRIRNELSGRIIRYKFFPIGVKDKPRHPVFQGWRYDEDMPERKT